jgi:hypothetical protein
MRKLEPRLQEVRVEIVTTSFVASGCPDGIHDLGRLLENLNGGSLGAQIELRSPAIRPLYRATPSLHLDAPLLVRREDIIFANFEGPHFTRGSSPRATTDVPVLLLAPPFQIQGAFAAPLDADAAQALRFTAERFFIVRNARVFDTEGAPLGDGERVVVNGAAVEMLSATRQHISAGAQITEIRRPTPSAAEETAAGKRDARAA